MEHTRKLRTWGGFLLLLVLLVTFLIWNLLAGSVRLPASEIWAVLHGGGDLTQRRILLNIRLPRLLAAMILGGALSVSGFLLQTFFHNPIAGPFVLGISSGAKFTVAVTMILLLSRGVTSSSAALIAAAFVGAMLSMGFVLLISRRVRRMSLLVVCGVMIGYICSAVTDFVVTFADDSNIINLHNWSQGSFSGMSWSNVKVAALMVGITLILTFFLSKPIGAYQLGEMYAQSMGVNIRVFRVLLILLSSVFSACVTAFAGPISFVGIAVPYLIKHLLGTAKPLVVIPATFLGGAVFCMGCDLIARMAFAPLELNISTVTSIFGAPIVIFMMIKNTLKHDIRISLLLQFFISQRRMHPHILQLLDQKRVSFLSIDITGKFQLADIMKHTCDCHLITECFIPSHLSCYCIRKITYNDSMI